MEYIQAENMVGIKQRLYSLATIRQLAVQSDSNPQLQQSILAKLDAEKVRIQNLAFEKTLEDGRICVRHPGIGCITVEHGRLDTPERLFGNRAKSVLAYTLTVSRADALISPSGSIEYVPYQAVARVRMSETAFCNFLANEQASPATMLEHATADIEAPIEDAISAIPLRLSQSMKRITEKSKERALEARQAALAAKEKGGKLSQSTMKEIQEAINASSLNLVSNMEFIVKCFSEYSDEVAMEQRTEIEALIRFEQLHGERA